MFLQGTAQQHRPSALTGVKEVRRWADATTHQHDGLATFTATYDAQDRLTAYGALTYTYTANEDLQSVSSNAGTTAYSYDLFGNLTAAPVSPGVVALPDAQLGFRKGILGRDPDGHALQIVER